MVSAHAYKASATKEDMLEVVAGLISKGQKTRREHCFGSSLVARWKGVKAVKKLSRECKEELDVLVSVGEVFMEVTHEYPDVTIRLTLFNAEIVEGEPKMIEHNDLKWITAEEISCFDFCPADQEILEKIKKVKKA